MFWFFFSLHSIGHWKCWWRVRNRFEFPHSMISIAFHHSFICHVPNLLWIVEIEEAHDAIWLIEYLISKIDRVHRHRTERNSPEIESNLVDSNLFGCINKSYICMFICLYVRCFFFFLFFINTFLTTFIFFIINALKMEFHNPFYLSFSPVPNSIIWIFIKYVMRNAVFYSTCTLNTPWKIFHAYELISSNAPTQKRWR